MRTDKNTTWWTNNSKYRSETNLDLVVGVKTDKKCKINAPKMSKMIFAPNILTSAPKINIKNLNLSVWPLPHKFTNAPKIDLKPKLSKMTFAPH